MTKGYWISLKPNNLWTEGDLAFPKISTMPYLCFYTPTQSLLLDKFWQLTEVGALVKANIHKPIEMEWYWAYAGPKAN
jgi:hypothetical protein